MSQTGRPRQGTRFDEAPRSLTEWLTTEEAALYLKVRPRTLLLWTRQGKVKGYALSGTRRRIWRYQQADLDAALLSKSMLCSVSPSVLTTKGEQ
jgi:excisionase family DNA binding protein